MIKDKYSLFQTNKIYLLFLLLLNFQLNGQENNTIHIDNLRCNYRINPIGTDADPPQLSWQIISGLNDVKQSAYRILVSDNEAALKKSLVLW